MPGGVEEVFRTANDVIAARARALGFDSGIPFLCECDDPRCFAIVRMDADEYASRRGSLEARITLPAHLVRA